MAGPKGGPTGLSHYGRNYEPNTAGSKEKKQRWAKEIQSPSLYETQLLIRAKDQKKVHVKGQETQTESLQVTADT